MSKGGVQLSQITKRFGEQMVLPELDLEVHQGEFVVMVGPSGCGKSTTLRIVAGLESVSSGTVNIAGRDVTWTPPKERNIAMVFQSYALYPHMDVAGNMDFALRLAKLGKEVIGGRVSKAAKLLGIEELLKRFPRELSGGQRQRVATGRAITRETEVFLFDEPLSNLDAKLRAQMRTEITLLHKRLGKTMLYVTHDQIEAMTMAQRIVVMSEGHIQQIGTPRQVYNNPANRFVAGFIGSPAMNLIDGQLRREGDVLRVAGDGFDIPLAPEAASAMAQVDGSGEVTVGMRPEHFSLPNDAEAEHHASVGIDVDTAEYVGANQFIHGRIGGRRVVATIASERSYENFLFDTRRLYLFDRGSGKSLLSVAGAAI